LAFGLKVKRPVLYFWQVVEGFALFGGCAFWEGLLVFLRDELVLEFEEGKFWGVEGDEGLSGWRKLYFEYFLCLHLMTALL